MTKAPPLTLGTAGHIDHGKSALVRALTGTDPDRLLEEKRRGITIEIGFAELPLPDGTTLSVVDVPGHERFVKQMIAGATGIDMALLCIAADDGVMPQTEEHLAILELLGVEACIVVLTKADLADEDWLSFVSAETSQCLAGTAYSKAPIVACSSKTGAGLTELTQAIAIQASLHRKKDRGRSFRLPVDRAFTIKGSGTVVTGTLWSGSVAIGDEVMVLPHEKICRIRGIQIHDQQQEVAHAGNRVALNLNAVSVGEVEPGSFLVAPHSMAPTDRFDALFSYQSALKAKKPLKSGSKIRLAHGTREVLGRLLLIDPLGKEKALTLESRELVPGSKAWVQIRLDEPLAVARNDHFIVRSRSPVAVLGGGIILASHPRRRTILQEGEQDLLTALEGSEAEQMVSCAVALKVLPFTAPALSKELELSLHLVVSAVDTLVKQGRVSIIGKTPDSQWYLATPLQKKYLQKLENLLIAFHTESPELLGITKSALAQRFLLPLGATAFDALLYTAERKGILAESKGLISHPSSHAHTRGLDAEAAQLLHSLLKQAAAAPPTVDRLISESKLDVSVARRSLAAMEETGKAVRICKEYYYEKSAYDNLAQKVGSHLKKTGQASAAELKEVMGVSRKHAIPLLEYFDNCQITQRKEDLRVLGRAYIHEVDA
ncbi:MAG: selenocysteine-specific translation elongation factor [Coriobacteriia bacterium]|nr:selenocysteine-specific translation elongation factor [Coriobacteriia bacterium]